MAMQQCGAKKRNGEPCQTPPMRNGRCRMHGGNSLAWMIHPNYKHGRYSKYGLEGMQHRAALAHRKRLRKRLKAIKAMGAGELLVEARRVFGRQLARDIDAEDMRDFLVMTTKAMIAGLSQPETARVILMRRL